MLYSAPHLRAAKAATNALPRTLTSAFYFPDGPDGDFWADLVLTLYEAHRRLEAIEANGTPVEPD